MDFQEDKPVNYPPFSHSMSETPLMNSIKEEDSPTSPEFGFETPYLDTTRNSSNTHLDATDQSNIGLIGSHRPYFASPKLARPNSGFYSMPDANNSSSSIIYNPTFTFGGNDTPTTATAININNTTTSNSNSNVFGKLVSPYSNSGNNSSLTNLNNGSIIPNREKRRNAYKYLPSSAKFSQIGNVGPPPQTRNRSPVRSLSPDDSNNKRKSALLDSPFNFSPSTLQPPVLPQRQSVSKFSPTSKNHNHQSTPPPSASRASFRKGHRYKHSSVSMNFFQEPEVKIPLNIAKALPIPNFHDLRENLIWPKTYIQLFIVLLQISLCIITYQLGHTKNWNNFLTLSHFITYDIIGSLVIIFVENLSQFEVWSIGTLTFPFGLNRFDVLLSFASAVSLCFVGLDLMFHVLEETIVLFVERSSFHDHLPLDKEDPRTQHEEIVSQIPHSHHSTSSDILFNNHKNVQIWFLLLALNFFLANISLYKTYVANVNSKLKTKNPLITIGYTIYLILYPFIEGHGIISTILDHMATILIAIFILIHGFTIAEWTSTILLNGFSTTTLTGFTITDDMDKSDDGNFKDKDTSTNLIRKTSLTCLPITSSYQNESNNISKRGSKWNRNVLKWNNTSTDPRRIKSVIIEKIESLNEFKSRCKLIYENLIICKVNFNLYVVLIKVTMEGGSNDDESQLVNAIENCIRKCLPYSETTVDLDRL